MDNIFPDTEYGAIQCLTILSSLPTDSVIAIPDPVVEGAWKITHKNYIAVVYLKGYKDPWGNIREYNDWEFYPISDKKD